MSSLKKSIAGFMIVFIAFIALACTPVTYEVDVTYSGGSIEGAGSYEAGENVELTATPDDGYEFMEWGGDYTGEDTTLTFEMPAEDVSIEAAFGAKSYAVDVTYDDALGGIEGDGVYEYGSDVELTATPEEGYEFAEWLGDYTGDEPTLTFEMPANDVSLEAVFTEETYLVEIIYDEAMGSVDGAGSFEAGESVELIASPEDGYEFMEWGGDYTGEDTTLTFEMPAEDVEVEATFAPVQEAITITQLFASFSGVQGYHDGSFTGEGDIEWNYIDTMDDGARARLNHDGYFEIPFEGTLEAISIDFTRPSFDDTVEIEVLIDGDAIGSKTYSADVGNLVTLSISDIDMEGPFTLTIASAEGRPLIEQVEMTYIPTEAPDDDEEEETHDVQVHYIDVGYDARPGDAMLIQAGDVDMLVDSGRGFSSDEANLMDFLDEHIENDTIEYILPSHPHADHIGGYPAVFDAYDVENAFMYCGAGSVDSQIRGTFEDLVDSEIDDENVRDVCDLDFTDDIYTYTLFEDIHLEFYDTGYLEASAANEASVVFTLDAYDTRVLFNGDAYIAQEEVYGPLAGDVDILRMGHHGSYTSTGEVVLEATDPSMVIAQTDELGNTYGHPHYEAVARVYEYSELIPVYALAGGPDDIDNQRNGSITVDIFEDGGYTYTSEFYGDNPIELSATDYWEDEENDYSHLGYMYASATGITDTGTLRSELNSLVDGHDTYTYDDLWDTLKETDEDPDNPDNVIQIYTRDSVSADAEYPTWNREHVWPQSLYDGAQEESTMKTDMHHVTPADPHENSVRGNQHFTADGSGYDPHDEVKGFVARMMFYMDVRYTDVELVDGAPSNMQMGNLEELLEWNISFLPDSFEEDRNDTVESFQDNRNPFIDLPQFAEILYSD